MLLNYLLFLFIPFTYGSVLKKIKVQFKVDSYCLTTIKIFVSIIILLIIISENTVDTSTQQSIDIPDFFVEEIPSEPTGNQNFCYTYK